MKTSSAIKVLDGTTRAVYKYEFPGVGLVQKHFIATQLHQLPDDCLVRGMKL